MLPDQARKLGRNAPAAVPRAFHAVRAGAFGNPAGFRAADWPPVAGGGDARGLHGSRQAAGCAEPFEPHRPNSGKGGAGAAGDLDGDPRGPVADAGRGKACGLHQAQGAGIVVAEWAEVRQASALPRRLNPRVPGGRLNSRNPQYRPCIP